MVKKAVLIGCNYAGTQAELHGCVNDVKRMYSTLVERYGFEEGNITVLIDSDPESTQPTGVNIRSALSDLVTGAGPGDVLFVHYSGHGTRVPAETGEVDDTGYDECIVPCDMNLITDDDFRALVNKVPEGAFFTLVSDSCHSGGLIDHELEQIGDSSTTDGQSGGGGGDESSGGRGLLGFVSGKLQAKLQSRGLRVPGFLQGRGGDDEGEREVPYSEEVEGVKNKTLPLDVLTQILSQRTGQQVDVGNIRTSLFDMFGEDSSGTVKTFVGFALQQLQNQQGGAEGGGVWGLAQQFLAAKLNDAGDDYAKPAAQAAPSNPQAAFAGAANQRVPHDVGVLVSGCESSQTSADANPTGDPSQAYGALSNSIQAILKQTSGSISNRDLVLQSRTLLKQEGFAQTPCLYCSNSNSDALFICEPV
eukprot:TRINITY_DN18_c0_g1_i1.p1 TRINITY_DN18_c0_g1~~TRINITY_DN18_c0_g1_i1.p1  ORF type:complete len:419 (-),score=57.52 TRINITY_DN18_c0_g1_i1:351-1607(-)